MYVANEGAHGRKRAGRSHKANDAFRRAERRRIDRELRIAATAFEAQEGMMITDRNRVILRVNRAFTESTGYSAEDVIGKEPQFFRPNGHDPVFYDDMWRQVEKQGYWRGEVFARRESGDVYPIWFTLTAVRGKTAKSRITLGRKPTSPAKRPRKRKSVTWPSTTR